MDVRVGFIDRWVGLVVLLGVENSSFGHFVARLRCFARLRCMSDGDNPSYWQNISLDMC